MGNPPDLQLHWYALTLGFYWISVGDAELFRYTDKMLDHGKQLSQTDQGSVSHSTLPYDEYQLAHIDNRISELLFAALEPVPPEIAEYAVTVHHARTALRSSPIPPAVRYQLDHVVPTGAEQDFGLATDWWRVRQLDALYLRYPPSIHFWTVGETTNILWQTNHLAADSVPVWTATSGHYELPRESVIHEYHDFHARFLTAMRDRINQIATHWPRPHIKIDLPALEKEQAQRESSLHKTCTETAHSDWPAILAALRRIF